jgi:energy-coupling factor transport system ATP-binding protein
MKVGYLFQNPDHQIFGATLIDQLLWSFEFLGEDIDLAKGKAEELIRLFGLEGSRDTYPYYLSLGEKRILALASVLMRSPDYLILDEPTSSLDEERAGVLKEVLKSLSERGIGMLIITHDEGLLESLGHRMIRLSGGRVENV